MLQFTLTVVSPEKKILGGEFSSLTVTTNSGEITILPNHAPLFATLKPGQAIAVNSAGATHLAITGGFISVHKNQVQLLVDFAIKSEEIDQNIVEQAKKRAEEILALGDKLDPASIDARAELVKAIVQLRVAQKRIHNRG